MWKLYNGILPISLSSYFYSNTRTQYSVSDSRLVSLDNFVLFLGPKVWNEIPNNIRLKTTLSSFSKTLAKYLIESL